MKLYYSPGACSLAVHIALEEAGLKYETERVDLGTHKTEKGEDFYGINPKGYVPALRLDDGSLLTEVAAVLQYVADKVPDKKLVAPAGSMERYRQMEWLTFISSELHKVYGPLFAPNVSEETTKNQLGMASKRYEYVNGQLEGKQFLMGDTFSVADMYLFIPVFWSGMKGPDKSQWKNLSAWFDRVYQRPSVQAALKAEGLIQG